MTIQFSVVGLAVAALLTAAVVSLISTPVVRSLAFRVGAVDVPKDNRRMHNHPIPRMGGLAIFFGFILSVLLFVPLTQQLRTMLLGAVSSLSSWASLTTSTPCPLSEIHDPDCRRPGGGAGGQPDFRAVQHQYFQQQSLLGAGLAVHPHLCTVDCRRPPTLSI